MSISWLASEPTSISGSISFTFTYDTHSALNSWLEAGLFRSTSVGVAEGEEIPQFVSHAIGVALQNGKAGEVISVSLASNAFKVKLKKDITVGAILHEGDIDNNYKQKTITNHLKPTNKEWRSIIDA